MPDRDHQYRVGVGRRLARQQADHHVAFFVDSARDAAHEGDLELLRPAEIVFRQRQHLNAGGFDEIALAGGHHRMDQTFARAGIPAKCLFGQR